MSYLQQHSDKLNPLSNDVNRFLRLIRTLDKRMQDIQATLILQQRQFEQRLKLLKQGKLSQQDLKGDYDAIVSKQKQIYGYSKQKDSIANQLVSLTNDEYNYIRTELKSKIKDNKSSEDQAQVPKKSKKPKQPNPGLKEPQKQTQFLYDPTDLKYCYCNRGSFGEMVGCQHPYCEKEWFHVECVEQKSITTSSDWFCNDCLKLKQKFKKSQAIKEFL